MTHYSVHTLKIFRSHTFGFGFHGNFSKKHTTIIWITKTKSIGKRNEKLYRDVEKRPKKGYIMFLEN